MKNLSYKYLILVLCLLCACQEAKKSIDETLHPKVQKNKKATSNSSTTSSTEVISEIISSLPDEKYKSLFESASTLDSIQQALQNLPNLKGKELFFLRGVTFYDYKGGIISIDLQDPDKPENVDTYSYSNGEWAQERPVKITGSFPVKLLLAPFDGIKFSTAKKVYDFGVEKAKAVEGAEPISHVYFNQLKAVHVKEWYLMINGDRHNYYVRFDANGNLISMK